MASPIRCLPVLCINTGKQNYGLEAGINSIRYRGYYYDVETGFYYVSSRYYDPEVGRFISADGEISGIGGDIRGYNLYSYCFNNPVNMSDPDGNWPKWVQKIGNKLVNTVTKWVNKVKKKIEKACGFTTQIDKEKPTASTYRGIVSYETGTGYNKSFNTGKSVNVYNTIPNISRDIFDAGIGIDVNINGYGASMQSGVEKSFSVNLPNQSFEWGGKPFGRNYFKHSYIDNSGIYVYNKLTINTPEIGEAILFTVLPTAYNTDSSSWSSWRSLCTLI